MRGTSHALLYHASEERERQRETQTPQINALGEQLALPLRTLGQTCDRKAHAANAIEAGQREEKERLRGRCWRQPQMAAMVRCEYVYREIDRDTDIYIERARGRERKGQRERNREQHSESHSSKRPRDRQRQ